MEKFKDFLYDKNDILVAIVIILLAGLIITIRIDKIMTYPETLQAAQQGSVMESDLTAGKHDGTGTTNPSHANDKESNGKESGKTNDSIIQGAPDISSTGDNAQATKNPSAQEKKPPHSLYIASGSSTAKIAEDLVNGGILTDKTAFLNAVTTARAENKLKAGTFIIPVDSTAAEIVSIISK